MVADSVKRVLIAGYFDPLHEGHLDHIKKASQLGDYLIIVTHTDECTRKAKGNCLTTLEFREFMLRAIIGMLGTIGAVIISEHEDISKVIRDFRPDIFAKGGDRVPGNMPQAEIDACAEVGCQIVYGIGDLLNSSSHIKKVMEAKHGYD
jgi:cytidyltransferase-like protein